MSIQFEPVTLEQVVAQVIEVGTWYLECLFTYLTGEVPVHGARQVKHRGTLAQVGVDDNAQFLEFFEDAINGRWAHVGFAFLHRDGDGIG